MPEVFFGGTDLDKAVATGEEAEKLIALGYEFHYHIRDTLDLFHKKVIRLDSN